VGVKVGIVGAGAFAQCFIPLFKAHPLTDDVVLCDVVPEKLKEVGSKFGIERTSPSLDHLLTTDVDAVAVITQNWMHAPQAVQALRAGRDVYSAVPACTKVDEMSELVKAVEETGRIYMMGETSYYGAYAVYCRKQFQKGKFGRVIYTEGEYLHDFDHGLYDVFKWRGGERWKEEAGMPPMYYPTHAIAMTVAVTGAYPTHVSCQGFVDEHEDGLFKAGVNRYGNTFSNETALYRMSDGSSMRHNEFRRVGHPGSERGSMFGTDGCFEGTGNGPVWLERDGTKIDLRDELACVGISVDPAERGKTDVPNERKFLDTARVHDVDRLPKEFAGLPNGHAGSHQFLVDDFMKACISKKHPPVNVWQAARYTLPGIVAHESAVRGGVLLEIPDFGDGA
jgi:predicted dehydrogenase